MKTIKKIVALIIVIIFSVSFFYGCKKDDKNAGDPKPDIHTAMMNYEKMTQKKSYFEAGLKFTIYLADKSSEGYTPISFGQLLKADRIMNEDKIYLDATLGSHGVSDNFVEMVESLSSIMSLITEQDVGLDPSVFEYINGETLFAARLGYDGLGTYNAKGDYINKEETPDFLDENNNPYWVAIDETSILNLQQNIGFGGEISPKDYLMFSTMLDFSPAEGWIKNDSADVYYDKEREAYVYAITTVGSKLKGLILDAIDGSADDFDEDQYAEDLQLYAEIIPKVASWIKTPDSTINAQVDKDGNLKSFSSSIRVDIDINVKQLFEIAKLLMPEEKAMLGLAQYALKDFFTSSAGDKGTWTIRIELTTDEHFYYDAKSLDLSDVDEDMFLPIDVENDNRFEILIELDEE